jgi:hypothetical protein
MPVRFCAIVTTLLAAICIASASAAGEAIDLSPRVRRGDLTKVSVQLEAGGHTLVRAESADGRTGGPQQRLPMSVSAKLQYFERRFADANTDKAPGKKLAARHYEVAEAVIKVEQGGVAPQLQEDRRLVMVEFGPVRPTLYCPQGPLSREQLDLIDTVGNSCVMDELLPTRPVADGEAWRAEETVVAALLTLDTVAVCEVQSVLEGFNANFAKVRLAGTVHGTSDGAATEQEVRGVYLYDRRAGRVTRLNLAVREKRSIGGATPGLEAVAKLQITVESADKVPELADDKIAPVTRSVRTPARDLVFEASTMGFRLQHDRNWFITSKLRENVTMRRVDGSKLVAQCTFALLPPKSAGRQTTLEEFQKDVAYSLGKSYGQLVSTKQWQNTHGHYCFEVVVRGTVEQVPVEWHHYLVARESGHRVSAAVTIEGPAVARVAGADRALIDRLELFPLMPAAQTADGDSELRTR